MDFIDAVCTRLCRTLSREEAEDLLAGTEHLAVSAGEILRREGEVSDGLYFLLAGTVVVERERPDGTRTRLAEVEAPTFLGELSLVVGGPVTASARALTECRLRILARADFEQRLADGDIIAYKILGAVAEVVARRVLRLNDTLVELSSPRGSASPPDDLARFRSKLFSQWSF
jgi:CRP/FNR family transcriptional regulator, cyclic AMP receptor protein